jgi:hypothetical protein
VRNSVRQWLNVEGYTKLMPVLDVSDIGTVQAIKSYDQGVVEYSTSLFTFLTVLVPSKEVAHAIKLLRHAPLEIIGKVWILGEKSRDCV